MKRPSQKKPTEEMPGELSWLADIFVAGRKVEREIDFKIRYAEHRVKEYCMRRFAEEFARTGKRPPSVDYHGRSSHFTFIQTQRINMTFEKAQALRDLGLPVDDVTELKGLRVNYDALQRHHLTEKLRQALETMNVPETVLEECFEPQVQLKATFFDRLDNWVLSSGPKKKDGGAEQIYEVLQILQPANQVRNAEAPDLNATECFKLVESAEIEPEAEDDLDAA